MHGACCRPNIQNSKYLPIPIKRQVTTLRHDRREGAQGRICVNASLFSSPTLRPYFNEIEKLDFSGINKDAPVTIILKQFYLHPS